MSCPQSRAASRLSASAIEIARPCTLGEILARHALNDPEALKPKQLCETRGGCKIVGELYQLVLCLVSGSRASSAHRVARQALSTRFSTLNLLLRDAGPQLVEQGGQRAVLVDDSVPGQGWA